MLEKYLIEKTFNEVAIQTDSKGIFYMQMNFHYITFCINCYYIIILSGSLKLHFFLLEQSEEISLLRNELAKSQQRIFEVEQSM